MARSARAKLRSEFQKKVDRREMLNREWYSLRSLLGNDWAIFYMLLGGREAGKSYAVTSFFVAQYKTLNRPFYWLRLEQESTKKLLQNNAEKLIDPDIRRKWNLDIVTNGDSVYEVIERSKPDETTGKTKILKKKFMCRVLALSTFYNDKGSGLFDADFLKDPTMYYNICCDEMNREKNQKKTFDIVYAFVNELENLVRSTKERIRVICVGNTLEEASDLMCSFNFLPEEYGRFYLRSKRCVIDYIEPSEKYLTRRKGTIADILMPDASTFTNRVEVDNTLVTKKRLIKPNYCIRFSKSKDTWFTVWNDNIIARYNGELSPIRFMRPYIDGAFNSEARDQVISMFDNRMFLYRDLITFKLFQKELELLKPRK